jgi:hypothetical protein
MIASGKLIKAARAYLGWTQCDLGREANLHRCAVAYWERKGALTRKQQSPYGNSGHNRIEQAFARKGIRFVTDPSPGFVIVPAEPIAHQYAPAHARAAWSA